MAIWINTGTISISAGGTTVTGSGTSFLTGGTQKGDMFQAPDGREYEITNIVSDTQLSIFKAYQGTNVTDSTNWDIIPTQGYVKALVDEVRTYIESSAEIINQIETTGLSIENGGTGATTASGARTNLGLGNVDNTADLDKPTSTAMQTALDAKADTSALSAHTSDTTNPHSVTKTQVGLGNVDNTADLDKPISTAMQTALDAKADTAGVYTKTQSDSLLAVKADKATLPFDNLLINSEGRINQRAYVSGTATTTAYQYTLDRWRIVTLGQNLIFTTSANITTFTAPAGGVEQVVEGINIRTGVHTLSWTGTATATVNGTSVANGGQISLTGGANATVRFTGGTVSKPKLEFGSVATDWKLADYAIELERCKRYYERFNAEVPYNYFCMGRMSSATAFYGVMPMKVQKRTVPSVGASGSFACDGATSVTSVSGYGTWNSNNIAVTAVVVGATTGQAGILYSNNNTTSYIYADAEI